MPSPSLRLSVLSGLLRGWLGEAGMGLRVVKTGLACALAWQLAASLLADPLPVLAPLAALLTVQVTIYRSVTVGLQRAAAVVAGVLLALLAARVLGLHAWSIGVVVSAALILGQLLRLGPQAVQVPVSALLVLALGAQSNLYPRDRVLETLLGGAVAVVVNLVVVPPLYTRSADLQLAGLADAIAGLLEDVAAGLADAWDQARARGWLQRARRLHERIDQTRQALTQAEESVRYNPRRAVAGAETGHLRAALTALEHSAFQTRGIGRALTDLAATDSQRAAGLSPCLAGLLASVAAAMRAYADALHGDAGGLEQLRRMLEVARERQHDAVADLAANAGSASWSLHGSLLVDAARLLREMDPDTGPHTEALAGTPR